MSLSFWACRVLLILPGLPYRPLVAAQNNSDGVSPFGTGYGPDVVTIDLPWNNSFADYEGTTLPDLEDTDIDATDTLGDVDANSTLSLSGRSAQDFYLRLMPLGASITEGVHSTDGNGYRKWIRAQLRWKGWQVNMVGSKQNGNMADKDNEGHPGWVITTVHDAFSASAWMKPNLVLLNVGTNDCVQNIDIDNAGSRIKVLIDDIFDKIPGVTVILSTLVPARDFDPCASTISQQYRDLAATYTSASARLQLADMHSFLTVGDLYNDGIHPNDDGYKKMAAVWWDAISKAESAMQAPAEDSGVVDTAVSSATTCSKVAGNAGGPINTQKGSGHDDGLYIHHSTSMGNLASGKVLKGTDKALNDAIPDHMFFAQLVNGGGADRSGALDEWIRVEHQADGTNRYWMRQNLGGGNFADHVQFDVDMNCNLGPTYYFADFNNDGLDDFFCLQSGSAVAVSLNRGGNPPIFEHIGQVVPTHDGYDAPDVRIADMDGDGRADYCLVQDDGDILCSRNGGQGDNYYWQGFSTVSGLRGTVFTGKNKGDKTGVRLADLNGDFRSDWMWIGDEGDVDTWINQRGWGSGIVPDWTHSGITHGGMQTPGVRKQIKFGRIYGSGRLDYVYFQNVTDGYEMHAWQNNGAGGTKRKGDGVFYCDMRNTGSDDYVWIYKDGHTNSDEIYTNIHEPPEWGHDTKIELSVPGPRIGIHLADWNGDGKCDVLVQNKATGALTMWENRYDASTNTLSFVNVGVVTGSATCTQGWGVSIFDRGVRLADIDGDGRADILCIEPNGRITAWLNPVAGLTDVGQVKFSEGWDRANMRLADVENSGRTDLIHLDKYTGAATVFKNLGHIPGGGGSSFSWAARGVLYSPIDRGETMNFANQGGLGRADLVHVLPVSNTAYTYFNECGGGSGGDDGSIADPGLPSYSTTGDDGGDDSGDDSDDDDDNDEDDAPVCDYSITFDNLDDLNAASGDFVSSCLVVYALETLITMLDTAYANYTSVNDGYDEEFGYYVTYIEKLVPAVLDNNFMFNESITTDTMLIPAPGYGMNYFDCQTAKSGSTKFACSDIDDTSTSIEMAEYGTTLTLKDNDGYTKALADVGLSPDWVDFGDYETDKEIPHRTYKYKFTGFPIENSTMVVPNPKDIVTEGLGSISQLRLDMEATLLDMMLGMWDGGATDDPAQAYSTPVFMLMEAVDSMVQAKALGQQEQQDEKEEEKRKKNFILLIISVVLMFVPVIGEEIALATGLASLARAIAITGELGDAALAIYDSEQDPSSAIVNVLGMLLGVGAIAKATRDGKGIGSIATIRRGMSADTVKGLGDIFKNSDDKLQSILKICKL